ncbi:hypothetical protein [Loigolactobacillus jiayinensis]|uniref:Uncharacterized protein n=1 Tax=Loigolactobacillus jiayinensis TaxID=2486016 RepID=A0ABW1RFX4_9LACO|nr:hypothetical protein [Loigolactobacillus jiayinensis]
MTKKLYPLIFCAIAGLLAGCTANSTQETPSSSSVASSSSQQADSSESLQSSMPSLKRGTDHETPLLQQTWQFKQFVITGIKAEWDGTDQIELEIGWRNMTTTAQRFADVGQVTVTQGDQQLAMVARDDDFSDSITAQADEDFELTYRLSNHTQPLKISIDPEQGETRTRTVNLDQ